MSSIQLYRSGNTAFKLDSRNRNALRMVTNARLERKVMDQDAVSVTVVSVSPCEFDYRDYIIVDGRPYFINRLPRVSKDGRNRFQYDITFEGGMYELGRVAYTMAGLHGWDFIGTLYDFCCMVVREMNRNSLVGTAQGRLIRNTGKMVDGRYQWKDTVYPNTYYYAQDQVPSNGDMLYTVNGLPNVTINNVGGGWELDFEEEWNGKIWVPVTTEEKSLTYDNHTCLAVMHDLVSQWEDWEFAVEVKTSDLVTTDTSVPIQCGGKIVVRRKRTVTSDTTDGIFLTNNTIHLNMGYGKKGGISKITRESDDGQNIPSRIYFYGGTQNVPSTYRNTRICLPSAKKEDSYIETGLSDNANCEVVKLFDDIYPACKPFEVAVDGALRGNGQFYFSVWKSDFFDINAIWKDPSAQLPAAYGSYDEWLLSYGTGDSQTDRQRYLLYYYEGDTSQGERSDFPKNCYITNDEVRITFLTGDLAGMSFSVHEFSGQDQSYYEITCNRVGIESPFEDVNYMPNGDLMCKVGDKFIVEGVLMPASYVYANFGSGNYAAETLLDDAARNYIEKLASKIKIGIDISQDYIYQHNAVFRLYDRIRIGDSDILDDIGELLYRVNRLSYDLITNEYKVEIDDGKNVTSWKALSEYISKIQSR